jgi:outer membrane lipase/esterase
MAVFLAAGLAIPAEAGTVDAGYTSFWVFGDSLSDPGNLFAATGGTVPASPPYAQGRFSNGPVWSEPVSASFAAAGLATGNFAYGGALALTNGDSIPDFAAQRAIFGAASVSTPLGDRPLASVWFGSNDLIDAVGQAAGAQDPVASVSQAAVAVAGGVANGIAALAQQGISDFVVWAVPDLGATPLLSLFAPQGASGLGTLAAQTFNAALGSAVASLRASGLRVTTIDTFAILGEARSDPQGFGLTDATLPCVFPSVTAAGLLGERQVCDPDTADGRLFFDQLHPNNVGHRILSDTFVAATSPAPVPLPAGALLLVSAGAALGMVRRKARAGRALSAA